MKILVCGNPLVRQDSAALEAAKHLRIVMPEIEFEEFDSIE